MRNTRKIRRVLTVAVAMTAVVLTMLQGSAVAATTWGTTMAGTQNGQFEWIDGNPVLDSTADGTLHAVFVADTNAAGSVWPAYSCKTLAGKQHMGIYYEKSTDGGANWSTWLRLNPVNTHAERSGLSADGTVVVALYTTQVCYYLNGTGSMPRVLYAVISTDSGATFGVPIKLSSTKGRVDYPTVSVSNGVILVTYTNAASGKITVKRSIDNGATWTSATAGTTAFQFVYYGPEGYRGFPAVALASDGNAVLAWVSTQKGKIVAKTSTDAGATWSATATTLSASGGAPRGGSAFPNVSAVDGRLGVVYQKGTSDFYREYTTATTTWGAPTTVWTAAAPYANTDAASVALFGASQVGISWGACTVATCNAKSGGTESLLWSESTDNGATFSAAETVNAAGGSWRNSQQYPSVIWEDATTRTVFWENRDFDWWPTYQVLIRTGTG